MSAFAVANEGKADMTYCNDMSANDPKRTWALSALPRNSVR